MRLLVGIFLLRTIVLFSTAAPRPCDAIQPVCKLQQSGNLVLDARHGDRVVYRHVRGRQHTEEEINQRCAAVILRGIGDLLLFQFLFPARGIECPERIPAVGGDVRVAGIHLGRSVAQEQG